MSFRDQLREWLGGEWADFWQVSFGQVCILLIVVAWLGLEAFWRTQSALSSSPNFAYYTLWPLRLFSSLAVLRLLRFLRDVRRR